MIDVVKKMIIFFCLAVLFSCQTNYKELFAIGSENYIILIDDVYLKRQRANSQNKQIARDKTNLELSINPIAIKKKNIGIYSYARVGSHAYRGNFFLYDKDGVHIVETLNKEKAIKEIELFLIEYEFSRIESEKCLETVKRLLYEVSGDVF
jgi:hypothetical protein